MSPSSLDSAVRLRGRFPRVLLASRSPRRRLLLTEAGIEHDAEHPGFDDAALMPTGVTPHQWVAALAHLKAAAGAELAHHRADAPRLILGADTACVMQGVLIGTPRDAHEARAMLRAFVEAEHTVVTGVAILDTHTNRRWIFADEAAVRWGHVSDDQIEDYIASNEWQGKAGAYNLRERLDAAWPIEYDGDPTTIMGLPMQLLTRELPRIASELGLP